MIVFLVFALCSYGVLHSVRSATLLIQKGTAVTGFVTFVLYESQLGGGGLQSCDAM
jgi:hypothetical protein